MLSTNIIIFKDFFLETCCSSYSTAILTASFFFWKLVVQQLVFFRHLLTAILTASFFFNYKCHSSPTLFSLLIFYTILPLYLTNKTSMSSSSSQSNSQYHSQSSNTNQQRNVFPPQFGTFDPSQIPNTSQDLRYVCQLFPTPENQF
ncbi:hypothetical protein GIB67_036513 [Kingdonia uniflora]|uniref:Uncharacterized protein n=1 Tax=Kingdonia uniflora TaxID=39325 RepID=A0A7J7P831_9MAGN|nr:hypothetical protein GIB67_036513 [Kingdonia uniflora]